MTDDVYLRPSTVAKRLVVSTSTIYRWYWEGKLEGIKLISGTLRISQKSLEEFLAAGAAT